jgi:hypothetical protein
VWSRCPAWHQGPTESPTQPGREILVGDRRQRNNESAAGEQRDRPLKPLRAERWEAGVSVVANSYALFLLCMRGCGCTGRPAFRTPSFPRGRDVHWQSSGAWRREIAKAWLFESVNRNLACSLDGAQRNPGQALQQWQSPDCAALHPGYDSTRWPRPAPGLVRHD